MGKGDGSFQDAQIHLAGNAPCALVAGDFNGDGHLDLAAVDSQGPLTILAGRGDGTFESLGSYAVGSFTQSVAVGDFNGDGQLDLAVAGSAGVAIVLSKGDGTFQAARSYAPGSAAFSVAVGDFNGDGFPDLAMATNIGTRAGYFGVVKVLLGTGDGTFQQKQTLLGTNGNHNSLAAGDFNGDGHLDLVVVVNSQSLPDHSTVNILLGNGDGTFQTAHSYAVGADPQFVAVGDFNGDGHLDLAVATGVPGNVSVLLGNGDGTFQDAKTYAVGTSSVSLAVGDFNGDGYPDLAVVNAGTYPDVQGTVSVLLGNGDGTFQTAQSYAVGISPSSVAIGDFNRDGYLDLAVANQYSGSDRSSGMVSILLGHGDGTFQAPQNYAAGSFPCSVAVGDFNRDGIADLAVANLFDGTVSILLGEGDGTFQAAQNYAAGAYPNAMAVVGDFNGDSYPDLAVASAAGVTVLLNAADWPSRP